MDFFQLKKQEGFLERDAFALGSGSSNSKRMKGQLRTTRTTRTESWRQQSRRHMKNSKMLSLVGV